MKNLTKALYLSLLILSSSVYAGEWHETFEPLPDNDVVTAMASFSTDFSRVFAVAENGNIYRSFNGGNSWDVVWNYPDLVADIVIFNDGNNDVIVVVGENGLIGKSIDNGDSWSPEYYLPSGSDITSVYYKDDTFVLWAAAQNGEVWASFNFGDDWNVQIDAVEGLFVKDIVDGPGLSTVMLSVKNDSSFIHEVDGGDGTITRMLGDTIPDVEIKNLHFRNHPLDPDILFLAGNEVSSGDGVAFTRLALAGLDPPLEIVRLPTIEITHITLLSIFNELNIPGIIPLDFVWIGSGSGEIWQSNDLGLTWGQPVYNHPSNGPVTSILTDRSENSRFGQAIAMVDGEFVLKYSFELEFINPNKGDQFSFAVNEIQMRFTSVPDLFSVQNGIHVTSNLSGRLDFASDYDPGDSNLVRLNLQRAFPNGSIPGEKWNISLVEMVHQLNDDLVQPSIEPFTIQTDFLPFAPSEIEFTRASESDAIGTISSNFVTGFFNDDDILDLITFDGSFLNIFETDGFGNFINVIQVPIPIATLINPTIEDQLITTDLNNDGRLDLIYFDEFAVYGILNISSGLAFDFTQAGFYPSFSIRDAAVTNTNGNMLADLVVLTADSLIIREDIDEFTIGTHSEVIEAFPLIEKLETGDVDLDGNEDILAIASDGLYYYRGLRDSSNYEPYLYFSSPNLYRNILLADFDLDKRLDVITVGDNLIDIWQIDESDNSNMLLTGFSPLMPQFDAFIEDVIVHDFGGANTSEFAQLMDIAVITSDSSIKFFENNSEFRSMSFIERLDRQVDLDRHLNRGLYWDGNRNAKLDILAYDFNSGYIQNFVNDSWNPQITDISIESDGVHLSWRTFPVDLGEFTRYRLHRHSVGNNDNDRVFDFNDISDTVFVDNSVERFSNYEYALEVEFNDEQQQFLISPLEFVQLVNIIEGSLTGVLSDSVMGYLVEESVFVPADSSLTILAGVEIEFAPGAVFDVYGQLDVRGTFDDMVEIGLARDDSTNEFTPWQGIHLHPGADTVSFQWFSIWGANVGIFADRRPLKIYLGGIGGNNIGIMSEGDTLIVSNIVADSNFTGIAVEQNSGALIRNITAIHNEVGVVVNPNANAIIKNSVIWDNLNFDVDLFDNFNTVIAYSTIQNINGDATLFQVNNSLPPIYLNQEDDIPYRMLAASPTIDAGDPNDDFSMEPQPNGGRINQGLLGGTFLATTSIEENVDAPTNLMLTALDMAIEVSFTMPADNQSFNSTLVLISTNPINQLQDGFLAYDTALVAGSIPVLRINNLEINTQYNVVVVNSFNASNSEFLTGSITTLAPVMSLNNQNITIPLAVDRTHRDFIKISNTAGGTLISRLNYIPNLFTDVWFDMDTSVHIIPPFDSVFVEFNLHPNKAMPRGAKTVAIGVQSNSALDDDLSFTITMNPIFDDFGPNIRITAKPDSLVKQSAYAIHYIGDDLAGLPIGVAEDSIYYYHRLLKFAQDGAIDTIAAADSTRDHNLVFYPLNDGFYSLRLAASDPRGNINVDTIRFFVKATERIITKNRWHMVSIPRPVDIQWQNFVVDSIMQIFRWNHAQDKYIAYHTNLDALHNMGEAVWIVTRKSFPANVSAIPEANLGDSLTTYLQLGWNQIGTPITFVTAWQDMSFIPDDGTGEMTLQDAAMRGYIDPAVHLYNGQGYIPYFVDSDIKNPAVPWFGYFIKALQSGYIKYSTDFYDILADQVSDVTTDGMDILAKKTSGTLGTDPYLAFSLSLTSNEYKDELNIFGFDDSGLLRDASEPPHIGSYNALYFAKDGKRLTRKINSGFSFYEDVKQWDVVVESHNATINHSLSWNIEELRASGLYFYLVDERTEKIINMNETDTYIFKPRNFQSTYKVYVTQNASFKPEIIPVVYRLKQNYPNPFNPSTTISFGVPADFAGEKINIKIYNILGQEILELVNRIYDEGYHEVTWYGKNNIGQQVASGVYFYKLIAGKNILTRKMVLIR